MQVALHRGLVLNVVFEIDDNGLLTAPINDSITKKFAKITSSSDKLYLIDIQIKQMAKQDKQDQKLKDSFSRAIMSVLIESKGKRQQLQENKEKKVV